MPMSETAALIQCQLWSCLSHQLRSFRGGRTGRGGICNSSLEVRASIIIPWREAATGRRPRIIASDQLFAFIATHSQEITSGQSGIDLGHSLAVLRAYGVDNRI
jgi:hypothetical protein